jgi:hypothetical protein
VLPKQSLVAATYTLTLNISGSGSVSRNPTNSVYPAGVSVVLTATPASNWLFTGWSGHASGLTNPTNILMNSDKVIEAHFAPLPNYTLSLTTNGLGGVTLDPLGGTYPSNTTVRLQAEPAESWLFLNWSGDASGSSNAVTLSMNAHKSIAAHFAQPPQINALPQSTALAVGGDVTFGVTASGTLPLIYQWRFNGAPIGGATASSLFISNAQTTDAGNYSVIVSNIAGVATSGDVLLSVTNECSGLNVVTDCSEAALRTAIANGGTVKFCCNGIIALSNTVTISNDVALDATDHTIVISGNNAVRLFTVSPGVTFCVTNVWVVNGLHRGANGVGTGSSGEVGEGGAIWNDGGTVRLVSCGLTNNHAVGGDSDQATLPTATRSGEGRGGALANRNGTLLLESVVASGNSAAGGTNGFLTLGGNATGGVLFNEGGSVLIRNTRLLTNALTVAFGGSAKGGAIYMNSGNLEIEDSIMAGHVAAGGNGVFRLMGPSFSPGTGSGGAIFIAGGTAKLLRAVIVQNETRGGDSFAGGGSAEAGGIYSAGSLAISQSTLSSNRTLAGIGSGPGGNAQAGALLTKGTTTVDRTTFSHNSVLGAAGGTARGGSWNGGSAYGGAVANEGFLAVTNSTFALNRAQSGNSAVAQPGLAFGGALFSRTGVTHLVNVTLASNLIVGGTPFRPDLVGGASIANSSGTVLLMNSILAYVTNGNGSGIFHDAGYNISSDGSVNFNSGSSFSFTDPRLQPLGNYGGPTLTMSLLPDSPAIDFGGSAGAPDTDQRGLPRPHGSGVDIGAFEEQIFSPVLHIRRSGQNIVLTFEAETGPTYRLQSSSDLVVWETVEIIGPLLTKGPVTRTLSSQSEAGQFFKLEIR